MTIQHVEKDHYGSFFVEEDGKLLAEMAYSLTDEPLMRIDHTEVDDVLRGKNMGKQLLTKALTYAREKKMQVQPRCPFVKSVFERDPEAVKDVWRK